MKHKKTHRKPQDSDSTTHQSNISEPAQTTPNMCDSSSVNHTGATQRAQNETVSSMNNSSLDASTIEEIDVVDDVISDVKDDTSDDDIMNGEHI